jgi:hypothetical protein
MSQGFIPNMKSKFGMTKEEKIHPHDIEDRSSLFSSVDATSTELEILNLLNALVYYYKPFRVIETGTFVGFGTIAIADALKQNGFGTVDTIEIDNGCIQRAYGNIKIYDEELLKFIKIHQSDTLKWIEENKNLGFDFGFFDSALVIRAQEIDLLKKNGMLKKNFIAFIHDTSFFRKCDKEDQIIMNADLDVLSKNREHFEGQLSRGWRMIKF